MLLCSYSLYYYIFIDLGTILDTRWRKTDPEPTSKTSSFFDTFFDWFLDHFGSILGWFFRCGDLLFRTQFGLRAPWCDFGPNLVILSPFLVHFVPLGVHFGSFGSPFWNMFFQIRSPCPIQIRIPRRNKKQTPNTSHELGTVAESARLRTWIYIYIYIYVCVFIMFIYIYRYIYIYI